MILVDRHHADLLYSLQRLFEGRLGIRVYIPVGFEWWDEGYWRFGECFGDDRLAQQYLQISDGVWFPARGEPGRYWTFDPAHPLRPIRGVTLDWFRRQGRRWWYIMPSVQENAPGYRRLADEVGATFLYHVGNTGQYLDWSLDPLVISTSEAPLREGRGVVVHQEMDTGPGDPFGWNVPRPGEIRTVRNAVNAFNRLPGYEDFLQAEIALGEEWHFTIHGHEGRDGDIQPVRALGDLMRSAGWGWHDKPVGDGFGHVVHSWAAVGRPLIGHAEYYKGKMAEPFWRDGKTCLDLGARSLEETVSLMREIASNPDRHLAMCRAIRAMFDSLVDYRAEAQSVARLIGLR